MYKRQVKEFLKRKEIVFSVDRYLIKSLSAMAQGFFASLLAGLIVKTIGEQLGWSFLVDIGTWAMDMMGPAIGVAVAHGLGAPPLVLFASVITGAVGAEFGGPAGSFIAAVIGAAFGQMVSNERCVYETEYPPYRIIINRSLFISQSADTGSFISLCSWIYCGSISYLS